MTFEMFPVTKSRDIVTELQFRFSRAAGPIQLVHQGCKLTWTPYYVRKADGLAHFDLCISALPHRKLAS